MKTLQSLLLLAVLPFFGLAQSSGTLKGRVLDESKYAIAYANVYITVGSNNIGTVSDSEGYFTIKPLQPGVYNLNVSNLGYQTQVIKGIRVVIDKITFIDDVVLHTERYTLEGDYGITEYKEKLIDIENPQIASIPPSVIENMPGGDNLPNIIRSVSSDVKVSEDGKDISFRGARSGTSAIYIDGMKSDDMNGKIAGMAIGSFSIYTGGIPAKYGDVTGGIVVIETKGYFDYLNERKYKD